MIFIPRKKRIWYPGAQYHITSRGNYQGDIFREKEDYIVYLGILKKTMIRYPFHVYSYCLMTNHTHLQIKTIDTEIWYIMKYINSLYSQFFNEKYGLIGHLFQGRYHSEIIEDSAYALQTSIYIHNNPVKAKIVEDPVFYPWSSYAVYMGKRKSKIVVDQTLLSYFENGSRKLYKEYTERMVPDPVKIL